MDWSLQARSTATSPEFWSGWVLQLVHLASAENRPDVVKANVRCLHSTMKSRGALQDEPLDLTISCLNSKDLKTAREVADIMTGVKQEADGPPVSQTGRVLIDPAEMHW